MQLQPRRRLRQQSLQRRRPPQLRLPLHRDSGREQRLQRSRIQTRLKVIREGSHRHGLGELRGRNSPMKNVWGAVSIS